MEKMRLPLPEPTPVASERLELTASGQVRYTLKNAVSGRHHPHLWLDWRRRCEAADALDAV
jgi:hypothetical protein